MNINHSYYSCTCDRVFETLRKMKCQNAIAITPLEDMVYIYTDTN